MSRWNVININRKWVKHLLTLRKGNGTFVSPNFTHKSQNYVRDTIFSRNYFDNLLGFWLSYIPRYDRSDTYFASAGGNRYYMETGCGQTSLAYIGPRTKVVLTALLVEAPLNCWQFAFSFNKKIMTDYKSNKATSQRPEGDRAVEDTLIKVNLKHTSDMLMAESSWTDNDRNAITLFKSKGVTVLMLILRAGAELKPGADDSDATLTLQVLNGSLTYDIDEKAGLILADEVMHVHKGVEYSFRAADDSYTCCLLTVSK